MCLALYASLSTGQFQFHRNFFASVDEPSISTSDFMSTEERMRQLDEKLSTRFAQQVSFLRERIEQLEKAVQEMRRANMYDWNVSDSGSMYKIFATEKTWDEAQSMCKTFNAHLAVIDSEFKNKFVQDMIAKEASSNKTDTNSDDSEYWIGLKTKAEMSSSNSRFANFYNDEKVDGCAVMDQQGKWKIRPCNGSKGFVCQQVTVR
jgi:hypothetical protein